MKTNLQKLNFFILVLSMIVLSACTENEWEKKEREEMKRIEYFLNQLKNRLTPDQEIIEIPVKELDSKMYMVILSQGNIDGESPLANDYMILDFSGRNIDEQIRETTYKTEAQYWSDYVNNQYYFRNYLFVPKKIPYGKSFPGINIGLSRMKEGDSCLFVIPSKLAFYDNNFTTLVYYIKLKKVIKNVKEYDSLQILYFRNFLGLDSSHYLSGDGLFYRELVSVDPDDENLKLINADSVIMKLTASYLQENILINFIDNKTITLPLNSTKNFMIDKEIPVTTGLASVMDTLRIGTKSIILVPYSKAYGESGLFSYLGFLIVPPYTSIIYDVEVIGKK